MRNNMNEFTKYFEDILGLEIELIQVPKPDLGMLPMFLGEMYDHFRIWLYTAEIQLIAYKNEDDFSIHQLDKHIGIMRDRLQKKVVFYADHISALNRKRLIEKGINFIVPGNQLFLPDMLIDLRENFLNQKRKLKKEKLLPSSQLILLYHLLHSKTNPLERISFTRMANRLGYTKMAVTKAVDDLLQHELCVVEGSREKCIRFLIERPSLWQEALPLLIDPVLKRVYVDEKPEGIYLLHSNESALPEYSDMNPSRQEYFAIEKQLFYNLQENGKFINPNDREGAFCLELWKYNPLILTEGISGNNNVDPLSLYLSLQQLHDERVENALEMIIEKYLW